MVYSAVLVDDEPWSLLDIQMSFPFEEFGFEIAGAFQNPLQALENVVQTHPHLIVTDIRMPRLDGLALIERAREQGVRSEIVIISGYNEFEYAKRALHHGVSDYCLKPTDPAEVRKVLARVRQKLDEKRGDEGEEEAVPSGFAGMIYYIDTNFHQKLTLGELAARFGLNANYCCSLFAKYKGVTFSQYLTGLRIDKARELIRQSDHKIDEIARMVGFQDAFYFSKTFKKTCGVSPREYRRGEGGGQ